MADKILTIIVPSYNMEAYLPKCLGSLIVDDETLLQKLDVIVVNDGSKDRTSEIAHGFEAKYPGVFRVIDKKNGHYGSCINAALLIAEGFYIKILDADDWFRTEAFKVYLQLLEREENKGGGSADLIVNDFESVCNEGLRIIKSFSWIGPRCTVADFDYQIGHDLWMHALAYKTEKIRKIGYVQLSGITHTDIQWLHLPMMTVEKISYFPHVVYEYLCSREGNTSGPGEFYRTYHVQIEILKQMIQDYNTVKDSIGEEQEIYLKNHIRYRAMRAYNVYLLERSPLLKSGVLESFDDYLRNNVPWLYKETGALTCFGKIGYHYVQDWRKKQRITAMMNLRYNTLRIVLGYYGRFRKLVKHLHEHSL